MILYFRYRSRGLETEAASSVAGPGPHRAHRGPALATVTVVTFPDVGLMRQRAADIIRDRICFNFVS